MQKALATLAVHTLLPLPPFPGVQIIGEPRYPKPIPNLRIREPCFFNLRIREPCFFLPEEGQVLFQRLLTYQLLNYRRRWELHLTFPPKSSWHVCLPRLHPPGSSPPCLPFLSDSNHERGSQRLAIPWHS